MAIWEKCTVNVNRGCAVAEFSPHRGWFWLDRGGHEKFSRTKLVFLMDHRHHWIPLVKAPKMHPSFA